jgi:hypothetical protein
MDDINDKICDRFKAFGIIIIYYSNSMKLCKLFSVFNNPNTLKNSILFYKENFQDAKKIWNEFGRPNSNLGQDKRRLKRIKYQTLNY